MCYYVMIVGVLVLYLRIIQRFRSIIVLLLYYNKNVYV